MDTTEKASLDTVGNITPSMKTLKFQNTLAQLILSGEKDSTWRLFDDKDLQVGDALVFVRKETGEEFGKATILSVREKKMGEIQDSDFEGHETFASQEDMYETYRSYYGDRVTPDSTVKIIKFKLE